VVDDRTHAAVGVDVTALRHYRDDGPLVELVARHVRARRTALPPTSASLLPAVAVLVVHPGTAPLAAAAVTLVAVAASARCFRSPHEGRLDWLVPPVLRLTEYGTVLLLVRAVDPVWTPAAFAFLAAVAYHHYDLVYRLRDRQQQPRDAVRRAALGWEGRLLVAAAAAGGGVLGPVLAAAAVVLLAGFVVDGARAWRDFEARA
jgi:hypothetical protein